jgi:hypothetical protein
MTSISPLQTFFKVRTIPKISKRMFQLLPNWSNGQGITDFFHT